MNTTSRPLAAILAAIASVALPIPVLLLLFPGGPLAAVLSAGILFSSAAAVSAFLFLRAMACRSRALEKAENQANLLGQRFNAIMDMTEDGIMIVDGEGTLLLANNNVAVFHETALENLIGKRLHDILCPEDSELLDRMLMERTQGRKGSYDARIVSGDGSFRWLHIMASPLLGPDGKFSCSLAMIRDIHERKDAERQMNLKRFVIDNMATNLIRLDAEARIRYANNLACATMGYDRDELLGRSMLEIDPTLTKERWIRFLAELKASGCDTFEFFVQARSGDTFPVELTAHYLTYYDEEMIVAFFFDIRERKQAEEALDESTRQLKSLAEDQKFLLATMRDFLYRRDAEGNMLYVSPSVEQVTGYTPKEWAARYHELGTDNPANKNAERMVERSLATGLPSPPYLMEILRGDGTRAWLEFSERPYLVSGVTAGLVGVGRDVSDRIQLERRLDSSRSLILNIIDSMPSTLVGVDQTGLVTHWNKQAEEETAIPRSQAIGRPLTEVHPFLGRAAPLVEKAVQSGLPQAEHTIRRIECGLLRYADITAYPLKTQGREEAVIRLDDATERVRMEEIMVQSEKMLSVGGLAAGMAHEINNPLGAIMQSAQNLDRRLMGDIPANTKAAHKTGTDLDSVRKYATERGIPVMIETIMESGKRAARIIQGMLNFSRKSSDMEPCDLNEIVEQSLELAGTDYDMKKRYDFKKINIDKFLAEDLPNVPCSRTQITQVLLNLLRNSAQVLYDTRPTPANPRIAVRTALEGTHARIEVLDNGPGLPEEDRSRIFEPFYTTKEPGQGTGLGLSVSYFIITENHGGTFTADSGPEGGARFVIRLPLSPRGKGDDGTPGSHSS